ncbi:hypothetical protein A2U01_0089251, partial [Trifolium medium]|nr:hypothetical protein [Trifolium medium]
MKMGEEPENLGVRRLDLRG